MAGKVKVEQRSVKRKPRLCPECPHWASFAALKKLDAYVAGDIGCYTLACLPPMSALHSCVCMGAGVTFHEGWRKGAPGKSIVGVLGDSTFVHSGITGLINAAYNKTKGVIIILDNSTTAMTGGQQHPATGLTIRNEPTKKLILEDVCRACGVDNVDVVDPKNMEEFRATPGEASERGCAVGHHLQASVQVAQKVGCGHGRRTTKSTASRSAASADRGS